MLKFFRATAVARKCILFYRSLSTDVIGGFVGGVALIGVCLSVVLPRCAFAGTELFSETVEDIACDLLNGGIAACQTVGPVSRADGDDGASSCVAT